MSSGFTENPKSQAIKEPLDVVIVNYNSGVLLQQCLQYLLEGTDNQLNIIVVDNASEDDSLQTIKPQLSQLKLFKNTENTGFARACNQGAALGQANYIAFVNPDCFVKPEQLQRLIHVLKNKSNAALVGCRVLNADGSLQAASRRRLPTFWRVVFHVTGLAKLSVFRGINIKGQGIFEQAIKVEAVNGACYVVHRDDFDQIEGFDEGFPLHFEDLDLFTRILKQNKSIWYEPKIEVKHLQGQAEQDSKQIKTWKKQGLNRYFQKHRSAWEAKLINWLLS